MNSNRSLGLERQTLESESSQRVTEDPPQNVRSTGPQRNRAQLSCTSCRQSKLKCDRKSPCSQCVRRGRISQCIFPAPVARRKPAISMQNRLKHLESLVKNAMTAQSSDRGLSSVSQDTLNHGNATNFISQSSPHISPNSGADSPSLDSLASDGGQVIHGAGETTYLGATHWAAIFDDVRSQIDTIAIVTVTVLMKGRSRICRAISKKPKRKGMISTHTQPSVLMQDHQRPNMNFLRYCLNGWSLIV
jgi:hypothetical protein